MTYTYEQAIQDAPKHVKRREDLPTERGWYRCEDAYYGYRLRWFDVKRFSIFCNQSDADEGRLNSEVELQTGRKILGWCKPWWTKEQK